MEGNKVLEKMLDRLFASMVSGPSLNCRPHASRQRVDLAALGKLQDIEPAEILRRLLGDGRAARIVARVPLPPRKDTREDKSAEDEAKQATAESSVSEAEQAWLDQQNLMNKLRVVAEDARTYEQDTGAYVLNIGFPLLSLPPNMLAGSRSSGTRRILAPLALIPVALTVTRGTAPAIELACKADGIDLVSPNQALLAWLEQQTGKASEDLFADERGEEPWREIGEVVRRTCTLLEMSPPEPLAKNDAGDMPTALALEPAPHTEDVEEKPRIYMSAVIGLFPLAKQGLLRDMQAMAGGEQLAGPVLSFIKTGVSLDQPPQPPQQPDRPQPLQPKPQSRDFHEQRMVAAADPCQARAVKLARQCQGLVIHGPPGTGKSQTISNIIGDHLSRGQRVLMVCEKRTALDVVANRLEHIGLGRLCAVVHDPQRDQRELYRMIREQLDGLVEAQTDEKAEKRLGKVDEELEALHAELTGHWTALMRPPLAGGPSFHELMGQWLSLAGAGDGKIDEAALRTVSLAEVERNEPALREILQRGQAARSSENPWGAAAGISLRDFLSRPMQEFRSALGACVQRSDEADASADAGIPPFAPDVDLRRQAQARSDLATRLENLLRDVDPSILSRWAKQDPAAVGRARQRLGESANAIATFRSGPLDPELALGTRDQMLRAPLVTLELGDIEAYLASADKWYAFACFRRRSKAALRLRHYGLPLSIESAQRLRGFLAGLRARLVLQAMHNELFTTAPSASLLSDEELDKSIAQNARAVELLAGVQADPALANLRDHMAKVLIEPALASALLEGLRKSPARAEALITLEDALGATRVFEPSWLTRFRSEVRGGRAAAGKIRALADRLDTLESILRIREALLKLPAAIKAGAEQLLNQGLEPDDALAVMRRCALAGEITGRLRADPDLQAVDAQRLESSFTRYRKLEAQKRQLVCDAIQHRWVSRQKERLLAGTGSRLNGMGADLRRRLTLRGERALRLRQVVAIGRNIEGGDPLFDMCPVWMASPETVAQVFPRAAIFDIVIFDEASQCRLEEALPVLTRGQRLVISGDPQQLPPTRFFEMALATSEEEEVETEQQLFEVHQGEIEDLLAAALGLEIEQSYLDVHYRSRNADLIAFSNEHFYNSRLQAIPAHPSSVARQAPVTLIRINGVYSRRMNAAEADKVCEIVNDLLSRKHPPSIGIACFNIQQRDLILERLDDLAAEDSDFADRLAEARSRVGEGSFEGLFVKNLENVQGDERDHIIISTTYGPDASGRFYRRFGPLALAGGGRRLNVLVTRAREQVHLVTSIPAEVYRSLPTIPAGQSPGGGWLLFAYLCFAEQLAGEYEKAGSGGTGQQKSKSATRILPSRSPSIFAQALGKLLAERHNLASDVHWGNDGFCVDVALRGPNGGEDMPLGVLCDGCRFAGAQDPVEWDIFRTAMHESQGWRLHRLWTPHFFRDPDGRVEAILKQLRPAALTPPRQH